MFGVGDDGPPENYPIYGYMQVRGEKSDMTQGYGTFRMILKDGVRNRTTFTAGDSLSNGSHRDVQPTPLNWEHDTAADGSHSRIYGVYKAERSATPRHRAWRIQDEVSYFEAQIHGGVKAKHIRRLDLPYHEKVSAATIRRCRELGIEIGVVTPGGG